MEPTDARKAYPCFDEPQLKVKYSTTLVHREKYSALSNMNIKVKNSECKRQGYFTFILGTKTV